MKGFVMLRERITYEHDLPFTIGFSHVKEEDHHYHNELEAALVLRGQADYIIHHQKYHLDSGDLILVDTEDLHRISYAADDTIMLTLYADLEYFSEKFPNVDFMIFTCENYTKGTEERKQELQNKTMHMKAQLADLMLVYEEDPGHSKKLMFMIEELIAGLIEQFQGFFIEDMQFKTDLGIAMGVNMERLYRMVKYLYLNFDKRITLKDLAEIEHLSPYYVSHIIKDSTGLSFQNFLNYIRIEYVEKKLVEGKMNLTQISEFCGFSSLEYCNKCFKTWHGITPSKYKKKLSRYERKYGRPFSKDEAFSLLSMYIDEGPPYAQLGEIHNDAVGKDILKDTVEKLYKLDDEALRSIHSYVSFLAEMNNNL